MMRSLNRKRRGTGFTLIEVLITLIILSVGLLGVAGLQLTSLQNQLEAYQRAQAILLVEDMASRIRANAPAARTGEYIPATNYGLDGTGNCTSAMTTAVYDLCDWDNILAGEGVSVAGVDVGSVNAARGCIENITGTDFNETIIRITLAWQGNVATQAPISNCGENEYGDDDAFRRTISVDVVLADLE